MSDKPTPESHENEKENVVVQSFHDALNFPSGAGTGNDYADSDYTENGIVAPLTHRGSFQVGYTSLDNSCYPNIPTPYTNFLYESIQDPSTFTQTSTINPNDGVNLGFQGSNYGAIAAPQTFSSTDTRLSLTDSTHFEHFDISYGSNVGAFTHNGCEFPGVGSSSPQPFVETGSWNFGNSFGNSNATGGVAQDTYQRTGNGCMGGDISSSSYMASHTPVIEPTSFNKNFNLEENAALTGTAQNAYQWDNLGEWYQGMGIPDIGTITPTPAPGPLYPNTGNSNGDDISGLSRHQCQQCSGSFSRPADLTRHHVTSHSPNPPQYPCDEPGCTRSGANPFKRKDKLRDHLRTIHGITGRNL